MPSLLSSVLLSAAFCLGGLAVFSCFRLRSVNGHLRDNKQELSDTRAALADELRRRNSYERALGLPVYSAEACKADLWARAAQGDELAEAILHEGMCYEELMPVDFLKEDIRR